MKARIGRRPYYVPRTKRALCVGLRRLGVTKINGQRLERIGKVQLLAVYHATAERVIAARAMMVSSSKMIETSENPHIGETGSGASEKGASYV